MAIEPEKLIVNITELESVTALLYLAARKDRVGITVVLGHGAGANQTSSFMCLFASELAARGLDVMTFNFLYAEKGRRVPDPKAKLEACYRNVIAAAINHKKLKGNRLVIGGKSMGGRIASQVAGEGGQWADKLATSKAATGRRAPNAPARAVHSVPETPVENSLASVVDSIAALVLLGYPLHPPGKPETLRDAHLEHIRAPMLIVQGSRDAFGTPDELSEVIKRLHLPATLHVIEGGDHSFKVPKSLGVAQAQVYESVMDEIAYWLRLKLT